jgi:hypothetical protein
MNKVEQAIEMLEKIQEVISIVDADTDYIDNKIEEVIEILKG